MRKENELLTSKQMREGCIDRVEVLDKVKELILLPNTEFATTEQVSKYFEVNIETIKKLVTRNEDELTSNGYGLYKKNDLLRDNVSIKTKRGGFDIISNNIIYGSGSNKGIRLFSKRAILNVAMLLRDSEVAKEIRTRLLDVIQDVSENKDNVIENIIDEISEEKQLMLDRVKAETDGDFDLVCVINAKLFALKNKRIKELENKIDTISTNALTISESRTIINKLTRLIAVKEYNSIFGKAYSELYKQVNYKLGINIRARSKKSSQSYIDVMSDEEVKQTEIIVRNWADKVGIDVDKELNLAS